MPKPPEDKKASPNGPDIWHFPRPEFAEKIYNLLVNGPIPAVSMFAPRRMGKTDFLRKDLAPLAESRGHLVVYVNFWQQKESSLRILLSQFDHALQRGSLTSRITHFASKIKPKLKVRTPDGAAEIELALSGLKGRPLEESLLLLEQYCERLASGDKPAFLLFDEFQEITRLESAQAVMAALRRAFDKHKSGLATIFTGSSQQRLNEMFSARDAPFLRFANPIEPLPLKEDFVDHQLEIFHGSSMSEIKRERALEIFDRVAKNPLFFQRWLQTIMAQPSMSENDAIDAVLENFARQFGFNQSWSELNRTQRIMVRMVASQVAQIYDESRDKFIMELTGQKPPSKQALQKAAHELCELQILDKLDEVWRVADPIFESWVKNLPASRF